MKERKGPVKVTLTESYLKEYSLDDIVTFTSLYGYTSNFHELFAFHNLEEILKARNILCFSLTN